MSICAFPVHEQETSMRSVNIDFGGAYSIILSTWNFDYFLQLQSTKMISFHYASCPIKTFRIC